MTEHGQNAPGETPISTQNIPSNFRAGADIGGTFTDVILLAPDGSYRSRKVLSTTDDYSRGIVDALTELTSQASAAPDAVDQIVHGTTVATNAILENRGARTALITTQGFRDVLELRRLRTPQLYDRFYEPPKPIVERRLRVEVTERVDADGSVLIELDEASVYAALDRIEAEEVEAIAVSLIHAWRNPEHERIVGGIVRQRLPDTFLSLSSDVLPEIREYERTSTTVLNAFIGPVVKQYISSLDRRLKGAGSAGELLIMQSNGGVMAADAAALAPANIVESGPAAGVIAARELGLRAGFADLISFDMGGTTAKASLIEKGVVARTTEYEVGAGISLSARLVKGGGHALKLPVIDIAEVGAGGGSIVWIDKGGAMKVGPRSAGAFPGPACHNAGGEEPTVTDANVLLGYVNPLGLAGGEIPVYPDLAEKAFAQSIAPRLGLPVLDAAWGAHTVANATMIRAIKAVTTYRGRDPRDFALMAFGGNGPIHASGMAASLGIGTVIVPPAPGLFSAIGLLEAQQERHYTQTLFGSLSGLPSETIESAFRLLEDRARSEIGEADLTIKRSVDLRYAGQGFELTIDVAGSPESPTWIASVTDAFTAEHERTYGHSAADEPLELVNVRIIAASGKAHVRPATLIAERSGSNAGDRTIYFGSTGQVQAPIIGRGDLDAAPQHGPLIVEEYDSTTIVPPGSTVHLDDFGNIVMTMPNANA
ncbi:MAG: hydantoinase/oxoprolinase family protein [Thermomicrobiales bacterium]|nr:hydantoinase/oxoprolinase family protein [Thermomicrobiales bacterium]